MIDPIITCPKCKTDIKLTESLAAPIIESTRRDYERRLKKDRRAIADEEEKKARHVMATDLDQKAREIKALQVVIEQRDKKLTEAQKAQAELLRKERELDDAKREMDLTVEKRVQKVLANTRDQEKRKAEESLGLKVKEKEHIIASMQNQIKELERKAEQGS